MPTVPDTIRGLGRVVQVGRESAWTVTVAPQTDTCTTTAHLSWTAPYGATATTVLDGTAAARYWLDTRGTYWAAPITEPACWAYGDPLPPDVYAQLETEQAARLNRMRESVHMQYLADPPTAATPTAEDAEARANRPGMVDVWGGPGPAPAPPIPDRVPPPSEWAAAERRATTLLLEHLTPEQRAEFTQHHYVTVQTAQYRYRLLLGRVGNIEELDTTGRCVATLCVHPRAGVPDADTVLTQLLYLRYDEPTLRERANRSETAYGQRARRQALAREADAAEAAAVARLRAHDQAHQAALERGDGATVAAALVAA